MARFFLLASVALFVFIGVAGAMKKKTEKHEPAQTQVKEEVLVYEEEQEIAEDQERQEEEVVLARDSIDRIRGLFTTGPSKLPIVETIRYTSRVPWLKGRPAWITDYASYFKTSRHFIARSLNGKPDYLTQRVASGNKFNVLSIDKKISFYLLVDISRLKMHFYYLDEGTDERVLLKTYDVGLGRKDANSPSGCLTPTGKYRLGEKVAIYKPGVHDFFQDEDIEMIQVFGTRWIPFEEEIEGCIADAKGYGIHGAPWFHRSEDGELYEDRETIGKFDSDGCIRLNQNDVEELFAIVISRPTTIEVVKHFKDAKLPGWEADPLETETE